jgi:hypothetical protein
MLREGLATALFFTRSAPAALRRNPFNGAPDGVDWGQVERIAGMTGYAIDVWAFDTLAAMFNAVETIRLKRWQEAQKKAEKER